MYYTLATRYTFRVIRMKIYIGADHRGFKLKEQLKIWLKNQDHEVSDCGNEKYDPQDDYPDFAKCVAKKIQSTQGFIGGGRFTHSEVKEMDSPEVTGEPSKTPPDSSEIPFRQMADRDDHAFGLVICGSGVGVSVMANRLKGIICALGFDPDQARHARANDHANMLAIPSDYVDLEKAKAIVKAFLNAAPKIEEKYFRRARKLDE